jgi:hypothetical protein
MPNFVLGAVRDLDHTHLNPRPLFISCVAVGYFLTLCDSVFLFKKCGLKKCALQVVERIN